MKKASFNEIIKIIVMKLFFNLNWKFASLKLDRCDKF